MAGAYAVRAGEIIGYNAARYGELSRINDVKANGLRDYFLRAAVIGCAYNC